MTTSELFPHAFFTESLDFLHQKDKDFYKLNGELSWRNNEKDISVFKEVVEFINQDLSDQEFQDRLGELEEILLNSPLFARLNDEKIQVSKAHAGTTPFAHTINVLRKLKTDGLAKPFVRAARYAALFHDIAKIWGADGKESRFHTILSAWIANQLFEQVNDETIRKYLKPILLSIQYHHLFEELYFFKTIKQESEVYRLFQDDAEIMMLYLVCSADVMSVEIYQRLVKNHIVMVDMLSETVGKELYELGLIHTSRKEEEREVKELQKVA